MSRPAPTGALDWAVPNAAKSDGSGGANDTDPPSRVSMRADESGRAMDSMVPGRTHLRISCDPGTWAVAAVLRLLRLVGEQRPERERIRLAVGALDDEALRAAADVTQLQGSNLVG